MFRRLIYLIPAILLILIIGTGINSNPVQAQEEVFIEANVSGNWVAAYNIAGASSARLEVYATGETEPKCAEDFVLSGENEIWMDCWEPTIRPGDTVLLYVDSIQTKDHTVFELTNDVFDPDTGEFSGTAQLGTTVRVEYCNPPPDEFSDGECFSHETETTSAGTWEIVLGPDTVSPEAWFGAFISDEDGDQTFAELTQPPNIDFNLEINWLGINNFPVDSEVLVEIYSDETKTELLLDETLVTEAHGGAGWDTMSSFSPGNLVVANYGDGEIVKELMLEDLTLDIFDIDADEAAGFAPEGTEVFVVLEGGEVEWFEVSTTADSEGWFVDFWLDYEIDLTDDMFIWAHVNDEDGDMTIAWLPELASQPSIMVYPEFDWIDATGWPIGETVTLVIEDDEDPSNGAVYVTTGVPVEAPWNPDDSWIGFDLSPFVDLQPGHIVIMFFEDIFRIHTITNLTVLEVDPAANSVFGSADPGSDVFLMVNWDPTTEIWVSADPGGFWFADFNGIADPGHGDLVVVCQPDDDGDLTCMNQTIVTPGGLVDEILSFAEDELAPEISSSLTAKIENAASSIARGNPTAAVNKLEAFINQVNALRGNKITDETADYLIFMAKKLISSIG